MTPTVKIAALTVLFLFLSAFFSASETALFSIPRERVPAYRRSRTRRRRWVARLLGDGQKTLILILLGNLFVNVTVVGLVHALLSRIMQHSVALTTLFAATGMILVFGEVLPKNIALRNNERVALMVAPVLVHLKIILRPVLVGLQKLNGALVARFTEHLRSPSPFVTLAELKSGIAGSADGGTISEHERDALLAVLECGSLAVSKVMTHRSQAVLVSEAATVGDAVAAMRHARQTMCCIMGEKRNEDVAGIGYLADALAADDRKTVSEIAVPPIWVPDSSRVADLVASMLKDGHDDVCVLDEFGTLVGVFSLEIGAERILCRGSPDVPVEAGRVKSRCFSGSEEISAMHSWLPPSLRSLESSARTLNGLLTEYLGRIPEVGEVFAIDSWIFYIISSKPNFVECVLIKRKG